jgi:DNA helicase-4
MSASWAGQGWVVVVDDVRLEARSGDSVHLYASADANQLSLKRRWFRWLLLADDWEVMRLPGLKGSDAAELATALTKFEFVHRLAAAVRWHHEQHRVITTALEIQRWISREQVEALVAARPPAGLHAAIERAGLTATLTDEQRAAAASLDIDLPAQIADCNEQILRAELRDRKDFFDRIERSPLTEEQARAVVCFDNRVHVLAAAGSGKTSVMVARAAYAINRGFVHPSRVLLLAFNKAAAAELQQRIDERLTAAGISAEGVRASTFHSFGLDVIGKATKRKPRLADWLGAGQEVAMVMRIVDGLRDRDTSFRYRWDLYRLLFAGSSGASPSDPADGAPDGWDPQSGVTGFRTFRGEIVKSAGERMIADWLYLNGVEYQYEQRYSVDVADETHAQYRPDFYYPAIDAWHEHWAVGRDGAPPPEFTGYADGMAWKRQTHALHGTTLIETTWADVVFGDGLGQLANDLAGRGVELDWNPDRPIHGVRPLEHNDLARLVRTFMSHVKSNSLTPGTVVRRLEVEHQKLSGFRTQLFLDLYWPIHDEWNRGLRADDSVDFEDMLVLAAEQLEADAVDMGYDLIMVDEFQDASHARVRLIAGLFRRPGKYLVAVGDDWQAINRFAGADLTVMLQFEEWFGAGPTLRLSTTFRCPQSICDVASSFVSANPRQFRKSVRSSHADPDQAVTLVHSHDVGAAVSSYLQRLSERLAASGDGERAARKPTVDILGRYHFQRDLVPSKTPDNLDVTFRTVHGAKGLEADYVLIPGLVSGTYGFPSAIADSPVLDLAMASGDTYPHAEERRLLYVALTRAKRHATLFTEHGKESKFAVELMNQYPGMIVNDDGAAVEPVVLCDKCGHGTMVQRNGKFGMFLGCSTFPICRNTQRG